MKKLVINIIIYIVLSSVIAVMGTIIKGQKKHTKAVEKHITMLSSQINKKDAVIDSLLKRRMTVYDVQLNVTDKSKPSINLKNNRGEISAPIEIDKVYHLKFEDTNINSK